ncbi:GAF and ANTAR domain-containing protein [Amycolatopsis sp. NPDC026612]|uniref:GAF and ANTAR domain-containing protein n=1 Tax=Amycolatopsis sp. NPDC026612 TaxID=3155466 RepID=UPI0033ECBEEC
MGEEHRDRLWRLVAERKGAGAWADAVCAAVLAVLPAVDGAAVSVRSTRRAQEVLATTDAWTARVEELHYALGSGPSVEAFEHGRPVLVPDLAVDDQRWPVFTDSAVALGVGAVYAFPLQVGAVRLGTLTLYRRTRGVLRAGELETAVLLAEAALLGVLADQRQADELPGSDRLDLHGGYQDVHIATGMLAAELKIAIDDAFARLQAHAFSTGRSLLEVSRDVLERRLKWDRHAE